ncbi:MAG: YraN family protein [Proteobacteria bacterium]|nr:YraN family protein [Pseudomonadota bacterium]
MKKTYKKGIFYEKLAAFYLLCKGYRILKWRYKTPIGEIDLIVQKGHTIVAVEVKKRRFDFEALESITPFQKQRISKAMSYFLQQRKFKFLPAIRFDVIAFSRYKWPKHIQNAW